MLLLASSCRLLWVVMFVGQQHTESCDTCIVNWHLITSYHQRTIHLCCVCAGWIKSPSMSSSDTKQSDVMWLTCCNTEKQLAYTASLHRPTPATFRPDTNNTSDKSPRKLSNITCMTFVVFGTTPEEWFSIDQNVIFF